MKLNTGIGTASLKIKNYPFGLIFWLFHFIFINLIYHYLLEKLIVRFFVLNHFLGKNQNSSFFYFLSEKKLRKSKDIEIYS